MVFLSVLLAVLSQLSISIPPVVADSTTSSSDIQDPAESRFEESGIDIEANEVDPNSEWFTVVLEMGPEKCGCAFALFLSTCWSGAYTTAPERHDVLVQ